MVLRATPRADAAPSPPSVQVGLLGSARDLQRDLDRIATRADTNSADGLHYVLEETVLALLRAPEYWVYGEHLGRTRHQD